MFIGLSLGLTGRLRSSGAAVDAYAVSGFSPELVLDFATDTYRVDGASSTFSSAVTFARASTATYVDSSGVLQTASSGVARVGNHVYNGTSWVNRGLLLESEARTNLVTYSQDFTNAAWTGTGFGVGTLAVDATGPDGETSAVTLVDDAAGGSVQAYLRYVISGLSTSTSYTLSVYCKADGLSWVYLQPTNFTTPATGGAYYDLSSGSVGTVSSGYSANIEDAGGGWYRCILTFTTDASDTSGQFLVYLADGDGDNTVARDGTSSILIYGAQFEAGSVPSSLIPTTGSTVTRASETATVPAANMPFDASGVTIQMDGLITYADEGAAGQQTFARWYAGAADYITIDLDTDSTATGEVNFNQEDTTGGAGSVASSATALAAGVNTAFNIAGRFTAAEVNGAVGGTVATANTTPTILPDLSSTDFQIGHDFMGNISRVRVWAADLTDANLDEATL